MSPPKNNLLATTPRQEMNRLQLLFSTNHVVLNRCTLFSNVSLKSFTEQHTLREIDSKVGHLSKNFIGGGSTKRIL